MKKIFFIGCLVIASLTASADSAYTNDGKVINVDSLIEVVNKDVHLQRLTPKYETEYYTTDWSSNWFVGVQGGTSFFIGNPKGCGDLFDRTSFSYGAYIGKWHTPYIGNRLAYQGGKFKDLYSGMQRFNAVHADIMYNVTNHFLTDNQGLRKWDVIPYLGVGLIHGPWHSHVDCPCDACNGRNLGFMVAYGVHGRYRATDRLYVTAELGGMSTFNDFDNHGSRHNFGDGMLSLSVGVSVNIGKNGFKHPIDAKPYIAQNDYLLCNYNKYRDANIALYNQHMMDANTLAKLRAVLEAEGLLDQYGYLFDDKARDKRNYYQGLLSLRSRLKDAQQPKPSRSLSTSLSMNFEGNDSLLNAPVYFFFRFAQARLTDKSQLVNLDEIARIAKEHNLTLRIDGAADSATGSKKTNEKLSRKRAQYIFLQLQKRGIPKEQMKVFAHGGVNQHDRNEEDRNTKVSVYVE